MQLGYFAFLLVAVHAAELLAYLAYRILRAKRTTPPAAADSAVAGSRT